MVKASTENVVATHSVSGSMKSLVLNQKKKTLTKRFHAEQTFHEVSSHQASSLAKEENRVSSTVRHPRVSGEARA